MDIYKRAPHCRIDCPNPLNPMSTSNSALRVEVSHSSTDTSPKLPVKQNLVEVDSATFHEYTDMSYPHATTRSPASAVEEKSDIGLDTLCASISAAGPTANNYIIGTPPVDKVDFGLDTLCASLSPAVPAAGNKVDLGLDSFCKSLARSPSPVDKIDLGLDTLCASISPAAPTADSRVHSPPPVDKIDFGLDTLCASISPAAPTADSRVHSPPPVDKIDFGLDTLCASISPAAPTANSPVHSPPPVDKIDLGLDTLCASISPAAPTADFLIRSSPPVDKTDLGLDTLCASVLPSSSALSANNELIHPPSPALHADNKVDFGLGEFCDSLSPPSAPTGDTSDFGGSGKKGSEFTVCHFLNASTLTAYLAWVFGFTPPMSEADDNEVQGML